MEQLVTADRITEVYKSMREATIERHHAEIERERMAKLYNEKRLAALADGTIDDAIEGRANNEKRDAVARELFADAYQRMEEAAEEADRYKLFYDLAQLDLSEVRALLRLQEVTAA